MGVVNASQIDRCARTLDRLTFIQQHANSHRFEIGNHTNSIVIAKHSVDRPFNACQNSTNECKCIFKVAERRGTIITSQNAQIIFQSYKYLFKPAHRAIIHVRMEIAHVQQREAIKRWRQLPEADVVVPDLDARGICLSAPIQSSQLE